MSTSPVTMLELLCGAPWCAATDDDPTTAHRVEMEGIPLLDIGPESRCEAVCGLAVKVVLVRWKDLRTRGTDIRRCPACRKGVRS